MSNRVACVVLCVCDVCAFVSCVRAVWMGREMVYWPLCVSFDPITEGDGRESLSGVIILPS